jgi:hypothetical protein
MKAADRGPQREAAAMRARRMISRAIRAGLFAIWIVPARVRVIMETNHLPALQR